jgi:hypothetical protein
VKVYLHDHEEDGIGLCGENIGDPGDADARLIGRREEKRQPGRYLPNGNIILKRIPKN